jgi:hypothetical protein
MLKYLLPFLIAIFLFNDQRAIAQAKDSIVIKNTKAILKMDTATISPFTFSEQKMASYKKNRSFIYLENEIENQFTWWDKLWAAFWRWMNNILSNPNTNNALNVIWVVLGAIAIVFAALKLLDMDLKRFTTGNSAPLDLAYHETPENIHEINFEAEINLAAKDRNYRLAVRLLYLQCLKKLTDKSIIHWEASKTNHAYLNEISDVKNKQQFSILTKQFEYAWYGDFPVNEQGFAQISKSFDDFNQQK